MLTTQPPVAPALTITINENMTPTTVAQAVTKTPELQDALAAAIHDAARGKTVQAFRDQLYGIDIDDTDPATGSIVSAALDAVRTYPHNELKEAAVYDYLHALHTLASGRHTTEDTLAVPRLLALTATREPTVAVRLEDAFYDVRREQREGVCRYLAALAQGCDVRIVASGRQQLRLYHDHREDLPVSQDDITPLAEQPAREAIEAAATSLDPDGRPVQILRTLADDPTESQSYSALYAQASVSKSRVRQAIATLRGHDLVATYDTTGGRKHLDLLDAGRRVLDVLNAEIGRQASLEDCVSETGQNSPQAVYSRTDTTGPGDAQGPYRTNYLDRSRHAAAAAASVNGGMTTITHPVSGEDSHVRGVSVDDSRREVVAEWTATSGLQYAVSGALALASPNVLHEVLTPAAVDDLDEPGEILRGARQIGALSDDALDSADGLREAFLEWAEELADMTSRHRRGEYEDRDRHRQAILRTAHGLYGSLVHLLDALDYDLIRAVRIPKSLDADHREEVATAVAHSALIQSAYGVHAAYRQLYEQREDKRQSAWGVDVDARDPYGRLLGSFVFVGDHTSAFIDELEPCLEGRDVHEDAPEFAVPFPVRRHCQTGALRQGLRRILTQKGLRLSEPVVRLLGVFTGSVYDALEAAHRGLAPEHDHSGREVRVDEARTALTALSEDRLVPEETPTVQAAFAVLLATDHPISPGELAERAGVSPRSLRRHRSRLEALDVLEVTDDGWRAGIAFDDPQDHALPTWARGDVHLPEVADTVAAAVLDIDEYVTVSTAFAAGGRPPDYRPLFEAAPLVEFWLTRLAAVATPAESDGDVVVAGPRVEQTPLRGNRATAGGGRSAAD